MMRSSFLKDSYWRRKACKITFESKCNDDGWMGPGPGGQHAVQPAPLSIYTVVLLDYRTCMSLLHSHIAG